MEGNRRREQRWGKAKNGGRKRSTLNKGDHGRGGGGRGGRGGGRGRTYKRGSVDSAPLPAKFLALANAAGVCHPAAHGELRRLGPIEYRTSNVSARFFATSAIACSLVGIFRIRNRTTRPPGSGSHSSTIQNVPSFAWYFWTRRLALPACVTSRSRVSPVRYARLPRLRAIRSICPREDKADGAVDRGDRGRQRQRYSSSPCVGGDDGPLLMLSSACRCARGSAQYPATGLCTLPQPDSRHAGSVGRADRQGEAADETE